MTGQAEIPFRQRFLEGVEHFNRHEFWDAHESWEAIWLQADESAQFLQGLIQLAAAYHHVQRGTIRGAGRLFEAARGRLAPYPDDYCGLDRRQALETAAQAEAAVHDALKHQQTVSPSLAELPQLLLRADWERHLPEESGW